MIGTIDVKIQAHNPNFPLEPVFTFINSAQSFRIRNVPKRIGRWEINKVFVNVTYPDTTVISKECVLNGGVWVGTIEGCSISGKTLNGFVVTASGIDENELPISNYVLGVGDVFVQDLDGSISPDVNVARMYFYSTAPVSPKKGEATFIEDVLNIYDGTQWKPALEVDLTNYYDKDEIDDIIENVEKSIPTKTSDLTNDSGFITVNEVPTPSYIEDTNGNKIESNLNCKVKDLTLPWTVVDGVDTYTLNYNEQSEMWVYEETQTKKIELTYTTENNLWELSFYVWNNGEWQYDKGGTTTQEIDTTSLTILDWTLSRSILADDKLVTQTSGIGKLVSNVNNKYSTRVIVDEYDNVFLQKYSTGWYVSKINVQTEGTWVETNDYYAILLNARIDTEKNRLYFDIRLQDKNRNYPVYTLDNVSFQNYSLGELLYTFSTQSQWPDTITFKLTITNAETPVWFNITRLVPDSANNSGLLDTQITPHGQFITPKQIKPYTIYPGYAYNAVNAILLYGRSNGQPNGNIFITIDGSNDNKLYYRNSNYYPWMLSMLDGVTFETPLEMKFGYVDIQRYKKANRMRNFSIHSYCWLVVVDVDDSNQTIYFIKATENANGSIVPDTNFYILGTAHPITFSTNSLSVETIEGLNGITCTRQSTGTYIIEEKYFAYENDIPTKTSDLTNDSGFITSADIITKRDLSDMTVKGIPQNTNYQSWFTIKYGTTTENAYYYDEGRWESGVTTSVLATSANIYTLRKNQGGQLTNIGEFTLNNNAEATITYEDVTYSITGYVGEIVISNQLNSQIAALEARISALENNT